MANRFAAGVLGLGEAVCRGLHRLIGLIRLATGLGVLQQRRRLLEQAKQLVLRVEHDLDILGQFFVVVVAALEIPRGADDILLRVEQVGDGLLLFATLFTALSLLLLLLAHALGGGTVLAENLLERPHRGEEQVAKSPAQLAILATVVGPQEITHHLPHLDAQVLHAKYMGNSELVGGQAVGG